MKGRSQVVNLRLWEVLSCGGGAAPPSSNHSRPPRDSIMARCITSPDVARLLPSPAVRPTTQPCLTATFVFHNTSRIFKFVSHPEVIRCEGTRKQYAMTVNGDV